MRARTQARRARARLGSSRLRESLGAAVTKAVRLDLNPVRQKVPGVARGDVGPQGQQQVYQRDDPGFDGGGTVAWPAPLVRAERTIVRRSRWRRRLDPVVDLGDHIGSARWCRGVVTLSAMVAALVHVAPARLAIPPAIAVGRRPAASSPGRGRCTGSATAVRVSTPLRSPAAPATVPIVANGTDPVERRRRRQPLSPRCAMRGRRAVGRRRLYPRGSPRASISARSSPADRYDIVVDTPARRRGRTGGCSMPASSIDGQPLSLLRWTLDGQEQWLDAAGTGAATDGFTVPVADARLSSGFGMRFHPILGFSRMHQGVDLAAPYGTPIVAAAEGIVRFAGAHGGYGNFVQIQHAGGMGTGYGHMSGIVVRARRDRAAGRADRLCRLDRPVDRPALPFRGLSQRRRGRSADRAISRSRRNWAARTSRGSGRRWRSWSRCRRHRRT